ncbi:MAG: DNA recombination protein RmuC [Rikenellaceae bacterium]|nr:DNA recombination protein RmuC [Rikenellaceae bacterium]
MELYISIAIAVCLAVIAIVIRVVMQRQLNQAILEQQNAQGRCEELERTIVGLTEQLSSAKTRAELFEGQLNREREEADKNREVMRSEFKVLASEILASESEKFKATNKESLQILLKPFGDNLRDFKERVEKIHATELTQQGAIQNELKNLQRLNQQITSETANLTRALKGDSKYQGDWGEMVLATILESFNFQRGVHYNTQENFKDEEGRNLRPDVVMNLPGGKQIIIDSKVSLTAFVGYVGAESEEQRSGFIKAHLESTRRHVEELSRKNYQALGLIKDRTPDFVIMFMPNEPAFMAALQEDGTLWEDAYRKNVIIASPTNLFALLKIIDDLWYRDAQSRNALDIAEQGTKLYEKFVGFVSDLEAVGASLGKAESAYEEAMKKLSTGRGNLVGQCEKLQRLGVKSKKQLSKAITDSSDDSNE